MYNGHEQTAEVSGYDPQTMQITGAAATNAGTYTITVTPNIRWKDASVDPVTVTWTIEKADPQVTLPVLEAKQGTSLKDIALPEHFSWKDPDATVGAQTRFVVIYTPEDSDNYNTLELELEIKVIPTITEEEDKQEPTTPPKPEHNNTGANTNNNSNNNNNTNTGTQKPADRVETEVPEEEVVPEEEPTEAEIPEEEEEPATEPVPEENTEPAETLTEQPVEEETLPTPVEEAESSNRTVILAVAGITALAAIAVVIVLVLRKRR